MLFVSVGVLTVSRARCPGGSGERLKFRALRRIHLYYWALEYHTLILFFLTEPL